jgi:hypothetical protein
MVCIGSYNPPFLIGNSFHSLIVPFKASIVPRHTLQPLGTPNKPLNVLFVLVQAKTSKRVWDINIQARPRGNALIIRPDISIILRLCLSHPLLLAPFL